MNSYKLVTMLSSAAGEALLQQQGIEATSDVAHKAQKSAINASIQLHKTLSALTLLVFTAGRDGKRLAAALNHLQQHSAIRPQQVRQQSHQKRQHQTVCCSTALCHRV